MTAGFAPVILLAGGAGQFSSNVGVNVFECDTRRGAPVGSVVNQGRPGSGTPGKGEECPARSADRAGTSHDLSAWRVAGPGFVAPAGGIRYAFSDTAAVSVNLKLAVVFGNGFMFAPTPEAAVQYGF